MNILNSLLQTLEKMGKNGSWIGGAIFGISTEAVPTWINHSGWKLHHSRLTLMLVAFFILDWIAGSQLAKKSTENKPETNIAIDSFIRDGFILIVCGVAFLFDQMLVTTGSWIFSVFVCAFMYNFAKSLIANIGLLGWDKYFPIWLLNWIMNELEAKRDKYFPKRETEEKKNDENA